MRGGEWDALMRAGQFEAAWRVSDWSLQHARQPQSAAVPRHLQTIWDGTPLHGRRVLVRCYHGLGDTLQFLRYVPMVQRIASHTTVWIQRTLIDLVRPALPGVRLVPVTDGQPAVTFDVDVEVMELAHVFRSTPETLPPPLFHPRHRHRRNGYPCIVGVRWTAGEWDRERGLIFEQIQPWLGVRGIRLTALEEHLRPHEQAYFDERPPATIRSLAARIDRCDLVIAVDGMPAHLAGSLSVPTWILLKREADWRWLTDRTDSPWYPSMRVYRQRSPGAWLPTIERVRDDLAAMSALLPGDSRTAPQAHHHESERP
jgi:hypothetical protein